MPFEIKHHAAEHLVEVVYPQAPTAAEVADYLLAVKQLVDGMKGPWVCLVDQRRTPLLAPELVQSLQVSNAYAAVKGLWRSARLVSGAAAAAQASQLGRKGGKMELRTFTDRAEALAWLRSGKA